LFADIKSLLVAGVMRVEEVFVVDTKYYSCYCCCYWYCMGFGDCGSIGIGVVIGVVVGIMRLFA
jgi:hypothetical protein